MEMHADAQRPVGTSEQIFDRLCIGGKEANKGFAHFYCSRG